MMEVGLFVGHLVGRRSWPGAVKCANTVPDDQSGDDRHHRVRRRLEVPLDRCVERRHRRRRRAGEEDHLLLERNADSPVPLTRTAFATRGDPCHSTGRRPTPRTRLVPCPSSATSPRWPSGSVLGELRPHARTLHGVGGRGRAALASRFGQGLGHGRVLDAARLNPRPRQSRSGQGQAVGPHPGDPAPHRAFAAHRHASRSDAPTCRSRSTATCCRPTAARAPRRSAVATWPCTTRSPAWSRPGGSSAARAQRHRRGDLGRDHRRRADARPALRGGLPGRHRHERRDDRFGSVRRGPGHRRAGGLLPRTSSTSCSTWPPRASRASTQRSERYSPRHRRHGPDGEVRPRDGQPAQGRGDARRTAWARHRGAGPSRRRRPRSTRPRTRSKATPCSRRVRSWTPRGRRPSPTTRGCSSTPLNGRPGVHSARYAGERATYDDNVEKLLGELDGVAPQERTARFRTVDRRRVPRRASPSGSRASSRGPSPKHPGRRRLRLRPRLRPRATATDGPWPNWRPTRRMRSRTAAERSGRSD